MKFYATFGFDHPLAKCVQPVEASDEEAARAIVSKAYPNGWAGLYQTFNPAKMQLPTLKEENNG